MKKKVLIIDDDIEVCKEIKYAMQNETTNVYYDYTDLAIRERIEGKWEYIPAQKPRRTVQPRQKTPSLLIDIQAKILAGKGAGYERFAKVFNLKSAAQTLIYLQEHGLTDYADLPAKVSAATQRHNHSPTS